MYDFNDIFDFSFNSYKTPLISLDLTPEERELCKRYAKSRLLQETPDFENKNIRSNTYNAKGVVRRLIKYYEERQNDILKTK